MKHLPKEWAYIGLESNSIWFAEGPFTQASHCPSHETAFYLNSFDLTEPTPWIIPHRLHKLSFKEFSRLFEGSPDPPSHWVTPDQLQFIEVFDQIKAKISQHTLKKSVPVVVESSPATLEQFTSLPHNLSSLHPNLYPYGIHFNGMNFAGASPEFLFRSYEGKLRTMALAGTARKEEADIFNNDLKEIQEHEFVAQTLLDSLTPLGMTVKHERTIHPVGSLIHFHTRIDVELYNSHNLEDLIRHLHPTPALGPLPRTEENLSDLSQWRNQLGCPTHFGAPFGLYHKGEFNLLVAIRMISFDGSQLQIPAGCGIIEASRPTNEWRELELKRSSVKDLFNL